MKMPKFGIKNALFQYFWARVLSKLLLCFKSAPSNLPNSKICEKTKKCLNLEPKMPYLSIFGLEFEKIFYYLESASLNLSCSKV